MIKTYMLENSQREVVGYFRTLNEAKYTMKKHYINASILMLKGPAFGEGFHMYRLTLENGKFKREKLQ